MAIDRRRLKIFNIQDLYQKENDDRPAYGLPEDRTIQNIVFFPDVVLF